MNNTWKQQGKGAGRSWYRHRHGAGAAFLIVFCTLVFVAVYFIAPSVSSVTYDTKALRDTGDAGGLAVAATGTQARVPAPPPVPIPHYVTTPKPLKAIYMTQCVVGTPSFRDSLVRLIDETELNAVVIDVKDFSGGIAFPTVDPLLQDSQSDRCGARDMKDFVAMLHEKGIYAIARITVFQDPLYTKAHPDSAVQKRGGGVWRDYKGLSFVDVSAKSYWDYIVALSRETYKLGFDELNYDYIRFPSDGPMSDAVYAGGGTNKPEALEHFFVYLTNHVRDMSAYPAGTPVPVLSADLFGMVTTSENDLNIGQVLERALPYFDYIAPMIYPSHYPKGFHGWNNPNTVPYELIKFVLDSAVERTEASTTIIQTLTGEKVYRVATSSASTSTPVKIFTGLYTKESYDRNKIRPWLQDFDYGGNYGPDEVRAQIQATYDSGLDSWMLWAPSNKYTRGALEP